VCKGLVPPGKAVAGSRLERLIGLAQERERLRAAAAQRQLSRQSSDDLPWSATTLDIGDLVDAKDTVNNWCFACVIEKDPDGHPGEIKVHCTRWEGDVYDAWYNVSSPELAEYGTRSTETHNRPKVKQIVLMGFSSADARNALRRHQDDVQESITFLLRPSTQQRPQRPQTLLQRRYDAMGVPRRRSWETP